MDTSAAGAFRVARGLYELADQLADRSVPLSVRRFNGTVVVPTVIHDALCAARVATAQDDPDDDGPGTVLSCARCGLLYRSVDEWTDNVLAAIGL
jgi:hypothetical protein